MTRPRDDDGLWSVIAIVVFLALCLLGGWAINELAHMAGVHIPGTP